MFLLTHILFVHLIALSVMPRQAHPRGNNTRGNPCIFSVRAKRNDLLADNGGSLCIFSSHSELTPDTFQRISATTVTKLPFVQRTEEQRAEVLETVSRRRPTTPASTYRCVTVCPTTKTRPFTITRKTPAKPSTGESSQQWSPVYPSLFSNPPLSCTSYCNCLQSAFYRLFSLDLVSINTTFGESFRILA